MTLDKVKNNFLELSLASSKILSTLRGDANTEERIKLREIHNALIARQLMYNFNDYLNGDDNE